MSLPRLSTPSQRYTVPYLTATLLSSAANRPPNMKRAIQIATVVAAVVATQADPETSSRRQDLLRALRSQGAAKTTEGTCPLYPPLFT